MQSPLSRNLKVSKPRSLLTFQKQSSKYNSKSFYDQVQCPEQYSPLFSLSQKQTEKHLKSVTHLTLNTAPSLTDNSIGPSTKLTIQQINMKYMQLKQKQNPSKSQKQYKITTLNYVPSPLLSISTPPKSNIQIKSQQLLTKQIEQNNYIIKYQHWFQDKDTNPQINYSNIIYNKSNIDSYIPLQLKSESSSLQSQLNYKLAQSNTYYLNPPEIQIQKSYSIRQPCQNQGQSQLLYDSCGYRIEESVLQYKSIYDNFDIIRNYFQSDQYNEYLCLEKQVGLLVSIKQICTLGVQSYYFKSKQQQKYLNLMNKSTKTNSLIKFSQYFIQTYNEYIYNDKHIIIKQPYYETIKTKSISPDSFNQKTIKHLLKTLLNIFQLLIQLKIQYNLSLINNICIIQNHYKLNNMQQSQMNQSISSKILTRKYFRMIKQLLGQLLGIDSTKRYYSNSLRRDLQPSFVEFMNLLSKNGQTFEELRKSNFLQ